MKNIAITFILFLSILSCRVMGQSTILTYSGTLYDAIENPQRQLFTDTCQKWAINFLPIPSFDLNASFYGAADKTILGYIFSKDLDPYLESVKNGSAFSNRLFASSTINPFMLRFRMNKKRMDEFSIALQVKVDGRTTFKNEFVNLYFKGNAPYAGQLLDGAFDTKTSAQIYAALSIGYQRNLNKKITLGGKLSLLNGLANVDADISKSSFLTAKNYESIDVALHGTLQSSFNIENSDKEEMKKSFLSFKNIGLGSSLGFQYKFTDKFSFDVNLKDFGFIHWGSPSAQKITLDKTVNFQGVSIKNNGKVQDSVFSNLTKFALDTTHGSYTTYLPVKLNLGFNYRFGKMFRTSFVASKELAYPDINMAFLADLKLLGPIHIIGLAAGNTNNFYQVGGEFLIRSGGMDFYIGSEKLFNTIQIAQATKPEDIRLSLGTEINFGMAFRFGKCPKQKTDSPKDSDGDGIPDALDNCPFKAGPKENRGCPYMDRDGDGMTDSVDNCPDQAGPVSNNGCPIIDTDGDGLVDTADRCPKVAGPIDNKGCPYADTDGDGVLDKDDKCPTLAGPIANAGCPYQDADGDGVLDSLDKCPTIVGPVSNGGCPETKKADLTPQEQEVINKVFRNLQFETGKTIISPASFASLDSLLELLSKKTTFKLLVEGHTDNIGSKVSNMILSEKRAEAVKKYLVAKGIEEKRIVAVGYGDSKPKASNATAAGRKLNRRVEFTIIE